MARFYPLYVRRSDGKLEVIGKGKRMEINQPTDEQLDQKPDKNGVSDYYREVGPDESKHLDWRRKLGGMLAREMDWKDKNAQLGNGAYSFVKCGQFRVYVADSSTENGYMLVAFPENYRLYEHVKKTEKDGRTEVKSKTHAAGGNDRQDAYLYGHPAGRKKRYRSPADFFPHLLWMCTDESGDPDNCGCKICSPEDLEDEVPSAKAKAKQGLEFKTAVGQTGAGMVRQGSGQGATKLKQQPGTPTQVQSPATTPRQLMPTPLPPPKSSDQHIDRQYHTFMYRPGELVWFKRSAAWGLGAIFRRWVTTTNRYHYTVQPLSHPFNHPSSVVKSSDAEMRPWLAWSVPKYTNDGLNNMPEPPKYETADWQGILQKRYGSQGDIEVDGSIMAAKSVDSSYSLFQPSRKTEPEPGVIETHYDGMYLGAEKIWVGDPLRLQIGSGADIFVLHSVVERKRTGVPSPQPVYLLGDVYQLQRTTHSNPSIPTPASAQNNPQLPQRLTQDLEYRNARSIPTKRIVSYWKLMSTQSRIELNDIKGRWYEASLILPILQQNVFEDAARKGEIQEASLWMNSRGDCINSNRRADLPKMPRENVLRSTRRDAFGRAIPSNAEIKDGVQPPLPDNVDPALEGISVSQSSMEIDPRFETADNNESSEIQVARQEPAIEDFMNLDGMEEQSGSQQMPGFDQEYVSQSQSQSGYY